MAAMLQLGAAGQALFNVKSFGAAGDGKRLETRAINRAVAACAKAGGGTVFVPPGRYLTGTIVLRSHVTLEIGPGATLLASQDPADYPLTPNVWEPGKQILAPVIYAEDAEDITITNCVMHQGHGGVTIGSEMSGGVHNVSVSNCVFQGTDIGIRVKSQRGRGGVVEGLSVTNIVMQDVSHPFTITTFYMGQDRSEDVYPVDEGTPRFRDFLFSNITARGAKDAGSITGLREMPVEGITFSNVHIQSATGFTCTNARDIAFRDVEIDAATGPALTLHNSTQIDSARLNAPPIREGRNDG